MGILYSAFCLLRLPRTQLLDSGFWILKISGSLSGGEPSWELEVGKLRSWILVARSGEPVLQFWKLYSGKLSSNLRSRSEASRTSVRFGTYEMAHPQGPFHTYRGVEPAILYSRILGFWMLLASARFNEGYATGESAPSVLTRYPA